MNPAPAAFALTALVALITGVFAGYYLRALRDYVKRLQALAEDARYPKTRTFADKYRLEDMWAVIDQALDELELHKLHTRQEDERKMREIETLSKHFADVRDRIVDARKSAPSDFPEEPKFPTNRKETSP